MGERERAWVEWVKAREATIAALAEQKGWVDSMCAYAKAIFPTLPIGVVPQHNKFEPTKSYRVCEFLVDQYAAWFGPVEAWRDDALAMAQRDGMRILFGANELNGGRRAPIARSRRTACGGGIRFWRERDAGSGYGDGMMGGSTTPRIARPISR